MTKRREITPSPEPLEAYVGHFDDVFGKSNQREEFRRYLEGLLLPTERHKTLTGLVNTEPVVGAQLPRAQKLQWFLSESTWDERKLQAKRLQLLLNDPSTAPTERGVLVIDETGDRKDGHKTAHVSRQYLANLGKIDNGVVSVSSLWADERVYYPVDFEPYTPAGYFAKGKDDAHFRTKPKIALQLVERALQERILFRAVVADSLYGEDRGFRSGLRELKQPYVLALKPSHGWWHPEDVAGTLQDVAHEASWESAEQPGKWMRATRTFRDGSTQDWWVVEIVAGPYGPDKAERAIVATTDPESLPDLSTWYLVTNLPAPTERAGTEPPFPPASLEEVIRLYGLRMWVEQSYKHVKHALGWSQYQVRSDRAIRRHWQLVWCAFSFCWYHASHPEAPASKEAREPSEPEAPLHSDVPAEAVGMGKKNQRGTRNASTGVLASGATSGARLVGALDHAAALWERLVATAPASTVAISAPALHAHLLDAYKLKRWADLPDNEPYLWDHLAYHLVAAGRLAELVAIVKDLHYLAHKTLVRTAYAAEADLAFAEQRMPSDVPLRLLTRNFANMSHLLNRCSTYNEIAAVLYSRLVHLKELSDLCQAFEPDIPRPYLTSWHSLPDLPDPALILTLRGHTAEVHGCAISRSGDFIVSASYDETLKVWDARTGEERRTLRGHTNIVQGCAISPSGDFIVSASDDNTLKVWDARTGEVRRTLRGHTHAVSGCAISPAGDFIVSASWDETLRVWDARTGKKRRTLRGHTWSVSGCAISPAGDTIVSASWDGTLKVWDARTGEEQRTLRGHTEWVTGCAISPSGDFIVSASHDGTLKVWDVHTGEEQRTLRGHTDQVYGCAISPSGDFIVSASSDNTLKVWDARTGEVRRTLSGHTGSDVYGCAISPAGDTIVSASEDRTLRVWDARTGEVRRTPSGHTDWVTGCAISPAGDIMVSASYDQTLKVWDMRTGEVQRTLLPGPTGGLPGCAISPSGDTMVSASSDKTLKVWDMRTGEVRRTLSGHTSAVTGCAISPAGDTIVSASWDKTLKVWDARTGEERRTLRGHRSVVTGCAISPAGDYIVSASADYTLKVWDARTGKKRRTLRGHTDGVTGCAISPSRDFIASASHDGTLKVWDVRTGEVRRTLRGHTSKMTDRTPYFHPNLRVPMSGVTGCAISPSGDFIVSASSDDTLKVWDARTGACLSTLYVNGPLYACAFHPDGEHLVAAGAGGVYFLRWVR